MEYTAANRKPNIFKKTLMLVVWLSILFLSNFLTLTDCKARRSQIKELKRKRVTFDSKRKRSGISSNCKNSKAGKESKKIVGTEKGLSKRAIIPVRKMSLASMAFKSIEGFKVTLQTSADAALSSTGKVQRQLKSYFSSDFEVLLLRMTAPDNLRLSAEDLDSFVATIETFVRNMDVTSQSNPYRVTLRKIWTKAAETDGRSVLKAQFLLHTLLKTTTPEDSLIFKTLLRKMLREKCKKTKSKYFDLAKISSVSVETDHLKDFIGRYSVYIFQRAKTFTSSFEEMKLIGDGMRTEDICAQLMKAVKVLNTALNCATTVKEEECHVVLACSEMVAEDVRDLFTLFHTKLLWVLNEEKVGDIFWGWEIPEVRAILSHLKTFYSDRYDDIQDLLIETAEVLQRRCKITLAVSLPPPAAFDDAIPGVGSQSLEYDNMGPFFPSISHLESSSGGESASSSSFSTFGATEDS